MQNLQASPPFPHGGFSMWEKWCHLQSSLLSSNHKGRHARIHLTLVAVSSKLDSLMVGVSGGSWTPTFFQERSFTFQWYAPAETKQKKMIRVEVEVGIPKKCGNSSPTHFYTIPFHLEQFPSSNSRITWSHRCIQLSHRQLAISCRASDLGFEEQKVPDAISFHTCAHHPGFSVEKSSERKRAKQMRTPAVSPKWWQLK